MTNPPSVTCPTNRMNLQRVFVLGVCVAFAMSVATQAAEPSDYLPRGNHHSLYSASMPPGMVGQARLTRRGPVANYFQPVAFSGPKGVRFSLPQGNVLGEPDGNLMAGLLIGPVYRFQVTGIPRAEGAELYPTVELIDRLYPPDGLATSFPIPIHLDEVDLEAALQGRLVTRVIYLEDPQTALPLQQQKREVNTMDISEHQDALRTADRFGRPVAILRIGSLAPPREPSLMPQFYFGFPPHAPIYQPEK